MYLLDFEFSLFSSSYSNLKQNIKIQMGIASGSRAKNLVEKKNKTQRNEN